MTVVVERPNPSAIVSVPCVWAVDDLLTTLFVSPGFAKLVGINRVVLAGLPWFVILPIASRRAIEWLVDTPRLEPTAALEIRHLEGVHIPVAVRRCYGGPGQDKTVLSVLPLGGTFSTDLTCTRICDLP